MSKENEKFDVDAAMDRLEEINTRLSQQDTKLNEALELYREGTVLAARCKEELTGIEKELSIIEDDGEE